jgi:hypothetical protein
MIDFLKKSVTSLYCIISYLYKAESSIDVEIYAAAAS